MREGSGREKREAHFCDSFFCFQNLLSRFCCYFLFTLSTKSWEVLLHGSFPIKAYYFLSFYAVQLFLYKSKSKREWGSEWAIECRSEGEQVRLLRPFKFRKLFFDDVTTVSILSKKYNCMIDIKWIN